MVSPQNPIHRLFSVKIPRSSGISPPVGGPTPRSVDIPKFTGPKGGTGASARDATEGAVRMGSAPEPSGKSERNFSLRRVAQPVEPTVGVFVTPASIATFPVASGAVVVIWKVLANVFPEWGSLKIIPLFTSFFVGLLIYYFSTTDGTPLKDRIAGFFIAIINSFFLTASALGIDETI